MKSNKFFVHKTSNVDSGAKIGDGTKIWHFSHVMKGAKIGKNCNLGQNVVVHPTHYKPITPPKPEGSDWNMGHLDPKELYIELHNNIEEKLVDKGMPRMLAYEEATKLCEDQFSDYISDYYSGTQLEY